MTTKTTWTLNVLANTGHYVDHLGPLGAGGFAVVSGKSEEDFKPTTGSHYVYIQDGKGLKVVAGPFVSRKVAMETAQSMYAAGREVVTPWGLVVAWKPTLIKARNECNRRWQAAGGRVGFTHRVPSFVPHGAEWPLVTGAIEALAKAVAESIRYDSLPERLARAEKDLVAARKALQEAMVYAQGAENLVAELKAQQARELLSQPIMQVDEDREALEAAQGHAEAILSGPDVHEADVEVSHHGSVVAFRLLSPAARSWVNANVEYDGWQWLGRSLHVEPRLADSLAAGMQAVGLVVEFI